MLRQRKENENFRNKTESCSFFELGVSIFVKFTEKKFFCFYQSWLNVQRRKNNVDERSIFEFRFEKVFVFLINVAFEFQPLNDQRTEIVDRWIKLDKLFTDLNEKLKTFGEESVQPITLKKLFDDRVQLILRNGENKNFPNSIRNKIREPTIDCVSLLFIWIRPINCLIAVL